MPSSPASGANNFLRKDSNGTIATTRCYENVLSERQKNLNIRKVFYLFNFKGSKLATFLGVFESTKSLYDLLKKSSIIFITKNRETVFFYCLNPSNGPNLTPAQTFDRGADVANRFPTFHSPSFQ